jgi:hypothetical protein
VARAISRIREELAEGISLDKCRRCGRMWTLLLDLDSSLLGERVDALGLASDMRVWLDVMEVAEYSSLDCDHCYPDIALIILKEELPEIMIG